MNQCVLSDTSALVLLWSDEGCYPSHQAQSYLLQLSLDAGKQLHDQCNNVWENYNEVIVNRKSGILYVASKTIFKHDISQIVILGAGLAPLDVELINRHKLGEIEVFSIDLENMPLKRMLLDNLVDPSLSRIHCVTADLNNISAIDNQLKENGYDKNKSTLIIMEGISYYLSKDNIKNIISYFRKNSPESCFILEYLVPSINIQKDRRHIPRDVFGILTKACGLPAITTLNRNHVESLSGGVIKAHFTLHDLEKMRTKGNRYFPQPDSGWIEICCF